MRVYPVIKRCLDAVLSLALLAASLPFLLVVAIAIVTEDRGPIFYVSSRVGQYGRKMKFYKFRTMVPDADRLKAELLKFNERNDGPLFKMRNDPRVTRIGRHLRKYSIDEIPQLISVAQGHMSLVGPRPHLPDEVSHYTEHDRIRLNVKPGLSCLPQILGRNSLGFREWIDLDIEYVQRQSFALDAYIALRTLAIVVEPLSHRFIKRENTHYY